MSSTRGRRDDPEIADDDLLWRALLRWHIVSDGEGGFRVSSKAFKDESGEVSVDIARRTTIEEARGRKRFPEMAELPASVPRANGQVVASDPIDSNPAHGLICPVAPQVRADRAELEAMAAASRILLP